MRELPSAPPASTTKTPAPLVGFVASLLFLGCNSTSPLTIEEHGTEIAQSIGTDVGNLKYIGSGHFASFDDLADGFNPETEGLVAFTETSFFWREDQG